MMGDVAPRPLRLVAAEQALDRAQPALAEQLALVARILPAVLAGDQLHQVEDRAVLDDQAAVHIGLAEPETRVPGDVEPDPAVGEADGEPRAAAGTAGLALAVGRDDREAAFLEQLVHELADQRHDASSYTASVLAFRFFSAAVFNWPHAASMSRPRGVRTGAEIPALKTMLLNARMRSSVEHS